MLLKDLNVLINLAAMRPPGLHGHLFLTLGLYSILEEFVLVVVVNNTNVTKYPPQPPLHKEFFFFSFYANHPLQGLKATVM